MRNSEKSQEALWFIDLYLFLSSVICLVVDVWHCGGIWIWLRDDRWQKARVNCSWHVTTAWQSRDKSVTDQSHDTQSDWSHGTPCGDRSDIRWLKRINVEFRSSVIALQISNIYIKGESTWSRDHSQPIRSQYPGHVITLSQSEARSVAIWPIRGRE